MCNHVAPELGASDATQPRAAIQPYSARSRSTICIHVVPELGAPYAAQHKARFGQLHCIAIITINQEGLLK